MGFLYLFFFTVSADAQVTLEYNSSLNKSWESFFTVGKQIQFIFYTTILIIVIFSILL